MLGDIPARHRRRSNDFGPVPHHDSPGCAIHIQYLAQASWSSDPPIMGEMASHPFVGYDISKMCNNETGDDS